MSIHRRFRFERTRRRPWDTPYFSLYVWVAPCALYIFWQVVCR